MNSTIDAALRLLLFLCLLPGCLAAQDFSLEETPRRYLVIRVEGASRDWEIVPKAIRKGPQTVANSDNDLKLERERWPRTGRVKRYDTSKWREVFERFTGAAPEAEGAKFEFYAVSPRMPTGEHVHAIDSDDRQTTWWVSAQKISIVGYPQTWVDIYHGYVEQFDGVERHQAVKGWQAAHAEIIENADQTAAGFSSEERNDFAVFYQRQFVYVRDRNPQDPASYIELAAYHREHGNLDAELSVWLDGLENGVSSPDYEEFALNVGRILVERLQLHEEALAWLEKASVWAEAVLLRARCLIELRRFDEVPDLLNDLVATIELGSDDDALEGPILSDTEANTIGEAALLLARASFSLLQFGEAERALARIATPAAGVAASSKEVRLFEEGRVLFAAMLLQRGQGEDVRKAKEALEATNAIKEGKKLAAQFAAGQAQDIPFDPLMAEALVLYAQTNSQYQVTAPAGSTQNPDATVMAWLSVARAVDPLSGEPWLAEGILYERLGDFRSALAAYESGLLVAPRDVRLNYSVALLRYRDGARAVAKDHLARCLRDEPKFYPAMVLLGEISLDEIDLLSEQQIRRRAGGEEVDVASELVPVMKEAAAFFRAALAIQPRQPRLKLSLASIYLQLADFAAAVLNDRRSAEESRRAYLLKARDLAWETMEEVRAYGETARTSKRASDRDIALAPPIEAFNVYAYACYALGDHGRARQAFEEHLAILESPEARNYFPDDQTYSRYRKSSARSWAEEWLRRIRANERQSLEHEDFDKDLKPEGNFLGEWEILTSPKPDQGFRDSVRVGGGALVLGVDQKETGAVSRLCVRRPYATITSFGARFAGDDAPETAGVHLTKMTNARGESRWEAVWSIQLGVDAAGRVFWEVRTFHQDDARNPEKIVESGYIDIADYAGPLNRAGPYTLALVRRTTKDRSALFYVAVVNGYEIELPVKTTDVTGRNDLDQKTVRMGCGFFATAAAGTKASVRVESADFVYDSGFGKSE